MGFLPRDPLFRDDTKGGASPPLETPAYPPVSLFDGGSAFQDWGWGRIQRGGRSPLIGRCGGWSLGGGHSRKCPPPMRAFGYFSHERKVTRDTGRGAPGAIE